MASDDPADPNAADAGSTRAQIGPATDTSGDLQRLGPPGPSCVLAGMSFALAAMTGALLLVTYVVLQQRPECGGDAGDLGCRLSEANDQLLQIASQIGSWVLGTGAVVLFVSACVLWARENPSSATSS